MNPSHQVTFTRDPHGREIASVALTNRSGKACRLLAKDYHRITAFLGNVAWFANGAKGYQYVRACHPTTGRPVMVARLVTGDITGTFVHYRDEDRFNLIRSNLNLAVGAGGRRKAAKRKSPTIGAAPVEVAHAA